MRVQKKHTFVFKCNLETSNTTEQKSNNCDTTTTRHLNFLPLSNVGAITEGKATIN